MNQLSETVRRCESWSTSVSRWREIPAMLFLSFRRKYPVRRPGLIGSSIRGASRPVCIHPKLLNGYKLVLDPNNSDELLIYDEIFIDNVYDLSLVPFQPDLVVDCGAFAGHFSLLARVKFPSARIATFEPHPDNFRSMRSNLELNRVSVETHCAAVSTYEGEGFLEGGGCAGRISGAQASQSKGVKVVDLRHFLFELSPKELLLKIDIEGEERQLLPLLVPLLPEKCAMFFEWHHTESAFEEIEYLLREYRFSVQKLRVRPAPEGCVYLDAFALRA